MSDKDEKPFYVSGNGFVSLTWKGVTEEYPDCDGVRVAACGHVFATKNNGANSWFLCSTGEPIEKDIVFKRPQELEPCGWCCTNNAYIYEERNTRQVICGQCSARGPAYNSSVEESDIVREWNFLSKLARGR